MNESQHDAKAAVDFAAARASLCAAELAEARLAETTARLRLQRAIKADPASWGPEKTQ